MIYHLLYVSYGDRHNVEVADYLKGKLVEEYKTHSETVSIVCIVVSIKFLCNMFVFRSSVSLLRINTPQIFG